jgi:hypothetical protein
MKKQKQKLTFLRFEKETSLTIFLVNESVLEWFLELLL